jgi:hypothetical protein
VANAALGVHVEDVATAGVEGDPDGVARMDGERVGIDAELAVSLRVHTPTPFTALTDVSLGNEVTRRRGEYVICFPSPTDTVWSVAKRYHAPMAALLAVNNLPAGSKADARESLEGVGYLIV